MQDYSGLQLLSVTVSVVRVVSPVLVQSDTHGDKKTDVDIWCDRQEIAVRGAVATPWTIDLAHRQPACINYCSTCGEVPLKHNILNRFLQATRTHMSEYYVCCGQM